MKIIPVILLVLFILVGCGTTGQENKYKKIIALTDSQVSNFVFVLPVILDFAEQYQATLSDKDKESPDYQEKYDSALRTSMKIKNASEANHFKNTDELLQVYQNVALVYQDLNTDFTNYNQAIQILNSKLEGFQTKYDTLKTNKDLSPEDKIELENMKTTLDNNHKRYSNIMIVKQYKKAIDDIAANSSAN